MGCVNYGTNLARHRFLLCQQIEGQPNLACSCLIACVAVGEITQANSKQIMLSPALVRNSGTAVARLVPSA